MYRTLHGRLWHWPATPKQGRTETVSACSHAPLDTAWPTTPAAALMQDRCQQNGCRQAWEAWLRRTLIAALADEAERLRKAS